MVSVMKKFKNLKSCNQEAAPLCICHHIRFCAGPAAKEKEELDLTRTGWKCQRKDSSGGGQPWHSSQRTPASSSSSPTPSPLLQGEHLWLVSDPPRQQGSRDDAKVMHSVGASRAGSEEASGRVEGSRGKELRGGFPSTRQAIVAADPPTSAAEPSEATGVPARPGRG